MKFSNISTGTTILNQSRHRNQNIINRIQKEAEKCVLFLEIIIIIVHHHNSTPTFKQFKQFVYYFLCFLSSITLQL